MHQTFISPSCWGCSVLDQGAEIQCLVRACPLVHREPAIFSLCPHGVEGVAGVGGALWSPLYRHYFHLEGFILMTHHLPKAFPPQTIMIELRISTHEFWWDTNRPSQHQSSFLLFTLGNYPPKGYCVGGTAHQGIFPSLIKRWPLAHVNQSETFPGIRLSSQVIPRPHGTLWLWPLSGTVSNLWGLGLEICALMKSPDDS